MESIDRQILSLLANDGRMSYTDIGRETGLSTSAAQQRVRRLEQRGIIKGYRAVIDADQIGTNLAAFIALRPIDPSRPDTIVDDMRDVPEVVSCYSVAGDANYMLKVQVPSPKDLEKLLSTINTKANCTTRTTLVLTVPYENRPFLPADIVEA